MYTVMLTQLDISRADAQSNRTTQHCAESGLLTPPLHPY